ncbi:MAG: hypothetical protein OXE99_05050 [Cellvibrionales bacterium]|nr:hypothetical protein [Cellvibrionales bacterium]
MKQLLLLVTSFVLIIKSVAADLQGEVGRVWVEQKMPSGFSDEYRGITTFQLVIEGLHEGPNCSAKVHNSTNRFAIDTKKPEGQAMLASLLWAKAYRIPVFVRGLGSCDATPWGDDFVQHFSF